MTFELKVGAAFCLHLKFELHQIYAWYITFLESHIQAAALFCATAVTRLNV